MKNDSSDRGLLVTASPSGPTVVERLDDISSIKGLVDGDPWKLYEQMHSCADCRANLTEHKAEKSPLQFAFELLGAHAPRDQWALFTIKMPHGWRECNFDTWLMAGWVDGQARDISDGNPFDVVGKDEGIAMKAWTVGLIAAQYANAMGWQSIDCRYATRAGHMPPLERYIRDMEVEAVFPSGSMVENTVVRGMAQPFMDLEMSPTDLAKVVVHAVNLGVIKVLRTYSFDPNPTVDGRNLKEAYESYTDGLDKSCPGWFWTNLHHAAPEIERRARINRSQVIARLSITN